MCGHYSVEWYTHGTLLLGATHLSLIYLNFKLESQGVNTEYNQWSHVDIVQFLHLIVFDVICI